MSEKPKPLTAKEAAQAALDGKFPLTEQDIAYARECALAGQWTGPTNVARLLYHIDTLQRENAFITPEAGDTATDGGRCPTCGRGRADLPSDLLLAAIRDLRNCGIRLYSGEEKRERRLAALTPPDTDPICTEPCSYDPGCPRECTEDCEPVSVDEDGGRK